MANTQASSRPSMVFTRYPELPKEIRLMIIEEAIHVFRQESVETVWYQEHATPFMFPLSSIDNEWNRVIEMRLFNFIRITPSDLSDFAEICSKRHGRLNTIKLFISKAHGTDDQPEYMVGNSIARLLHIMKDWDHLDRERQGLIEIQLDVSMVRIRSWLGFDISTGLGALPKVPIIGALYEVTDLAVEPVLHPSSSLCLYESLPNVRHVNLNIRLLDDKKASLEQTSNTIAALGTIQPSLTHLELLPDLQWSYQLHTWKIWTPATDCIAQFPRSWYNTLVRLDLKRVTGLPLFLVEAGKVAWPNLKTLVLLGVVDSSGKSDDELEAMNKQSCTALVQGLITMLPNTPNITTILIEMVDFSWNYNIGSYRLQLRLGNPVHDVQASSGPPCSFRSCSYQFVPSYDNATLVVSGTDFSGHVATELQHTVRHHQRKDLGVFFHYHSSPSSTWGRGRCWQWDPEKNSWDAVFENEANEFIYQMGQYFDWA